MRKKPPIYLISIPLILLLITCVSLFRKEQRPEPAEVTGPVPKTEKPAFHLPETNLATLTEQLLTSRPTNPQQTAQLVELTKARMELMKELIRTDPARALKARISWAQWQHLPPMLKPYVEEPISSLADVDVFIACGETTFIDSFTTLTDGRKFETFTDNSRRLAKTKNNLPVQGIKLDDIGALEPSVFELLSDEDHQAVQSIFPLANPDPTRCFATGRKRTTPPVIALSGGQIFYFEDNVALEKLEQELIELDTLAGPASASALLFSALTSDSAEYGFDLEKARQSAMSASAEWSGSVRDMYVILVDFSDIPGQPIVPQQIEYNINTYVSPQIYDMSYHQTYINGTVDPVTYRLPHPSTFYSSDHRIMHDHAVNVVTNSGVDLSGYETVCIYFPFVYDLRSLRGYASLGGSKLWLHNTANPYVITHELGHNYGSYHSHFWKTAGTNPLDPAGIHEEYGDITDIMGSGNLPDGHFHVQNKLEVGWLDPDQILQLTNSGTYRIHRTDHPLTDQDSRFGLRFQINPTNAYWVGYRQLYPEYETFGRGTYVLWQQANPSNYPKSHLLDMTPGSADGIQDAALALGKTWSDPANQFHLTPTHRGGRTPNEWMEVTVNLGDFNSNNPPASTLAGPMSAATRQSITYTVNASDPEGDDLAYAWDFGDGIVRANAPQTSHAWFSPGTQTVSCIVSDMKGGSVTNQLTVTVSEALEMVYQKHIFATDIFGITTDGSKLVAVGKSGFAGSSTNGSEWITGNVGGATTWVNLYSVVHDGSQFVAAGKDWDNTAWTGVIYTSPNGINWTRQHAGGPVLNDVAYGSNMLIAAGEDGTILTSDTGTSWNSVNSGTAGNLKGIAYNGTVFTVVGLATNYVSCVYFSEDGQNWHDRSSNAGTGSWAFSAVINCNGLLLAGGHGIGIRHSNDGGDSFSTATSEQLTIPAFAYGNGVYFAAGKYSYNTQADLDLVSTDGINWTKLPTEDQADRNAAVFFDNCFFTISDGGALWKSEPVGTALSGWAVWQYQHAEALGLNRDAGDDPDGDGVFNLVEYALGTDASNAGSTPDVTSSMDTNGCLQIEIERTRTAADINYIVERGTNLLDSVSWSALDTETVTNLPAQLIIRSIHPISEQNREFLRLRIGVKPPDEI